MDFMVDLVNLLDSFGIVSPTRDILTHMVSEKNQEILG